MVKNIPTIERSTKIRFGKHANDNQAENTIVFNASDAPIAASTPGSLYMTPLRVAELAGANFFAYHAQTSELVDSGVATDLLGGITLQNATTVGNTTANVVEFNHPTTSFVTSSNVGIANTLPTHALSVADKVFIKGKVGDNDDLRIVGNTKTDRLTTTGDAVVIDKDNTNKIQVSGIIHTGDIQATAHVAIANTNPQDLFTLGAVGQTVMNVPTQTTYALETTGNINAQYYHGDGGLLSNLNLQIVTDKSSITTNTLDLTNPTTSLKAYSNIVVNDYIFGNINGSNIITASEITGYNITATNQITSQSTQSDAIIANNEVSGPDIIGTSGIYGEIKGSNVVSATKVSGSIGLYGDILGSNVVEADKVSVGVGGIFGEIKGSNNISADNITATSITGSGSGITGIGTGNISTGVLTVARGGTGIGDTYTIGDITYASAPGTLSTLGVSSATAGQFLRLNTGKTAPEWSDVPLTLDEVLESQTGVSNVSNAVMTLNKASGVALEVTDAQVALNGTGTVLDASSGTIAASTFQGNGSSITHLDLGQGTNTGVIPISRGGTGAGSLTNQSIPYVNTSGVFEESKTTYNPTNHITSISSNVVISGNLTVQGNVTAQHTNDHYITDKIFAVAHNNTVDAKDMGQHMTRPTANVFAGFLGETIGKEYTIAYTTSKSESDTVVPTMTTSDGYITANVWGNVLSGNVTTTGTVTADKLIVSGATGIDANNSIVNALSVNAGNFYGGNFSGNGSGLEALNASNVSTGTLATARGGTGVTTGLTVLDPANLSSQVLLAKGGTGLTTVAENELLLGPSSGTALSKLSPHTTTSKKFLRSDNTGVAWDDVSSTLQAITDGGATTTHTVAFNNTTTGLTSAGDIDIADTKQIDYAGDVLLKSSAGAVASFKIDNAIKLDPAYAAPTNNVLSFNTTTGEIYDSGGQGGSTLDNIHEYKANVSIGPSVAAANLTVNVFESNVLTVSGNVAADNITIGALHVAASPFNLDDVAMASAGANVTSNVIQFTGPHSSYNSDNAFVTTNSIKIGSNVNALGNVISQNIQLTNPGITATMSSTDTITIDAKNKSYGTAPLVPLTGDLDSLVYSNLIDGAQIVVPVFASGADRKISKNLTNVNWYVQTSDLSITKDEHGFMTLSNVAGNVYMNSVAFTQN
tara:strand:- start:2178 stop:5651 length:3474 start_codon:yes stop_codon:yes gene_type:complete